MKIGFMLLASLIFLVAASIVSAEGALPRARDLGVPFDGNPGSINAITDVTLISGDGNGDMTGTHWVEESGVLETPILITGTGSVGVVRDAAFGWMADHRKGAFWYPVSAETADVPLNDMAGQHVTQRDTYDALDGAKTGPVAEGNVGGGTGMICNGFKGGTGTASHKLSANAGG